MSTFLFTAVNRDGKSITERVEADNLSQARYKLEVQGFSEITFYESELSEEVVNVFREKEIKNRGKFLKQQVGLQYDTRLRRNFFNILRYTFIWWAIILYMLYQNRDLLTFLWFCGTVAMTSYFSFPSVIFNRLHEAHCWDRNRQVRFWSSVAKYFNYISIVKIPAFYIDSYLSCADAREGNMVNALNRLEKHRNNPKVSKRMFNLKLISIYGNARQFDQVRALQEHSMNEGSVLTEELIDYAICLARRHKDTARAKNVLQNIFDRELTVMAKLFIPYCQGVIEVEDGNLPQAEFYLKQAAKELEPFEKNTYLIGLKSEVKAFLAITLGRRGEKEEAEKLFNEVKPYLTAISDKELIQRCEMVLS
jgi:hypothetical protein